MGKLAGQIIDNMVTRENSSTGAGRPTEEQASAAPPMSVAIYLDLDEAREEWRELLAQSVASPYQSFEFLEAWSDTIGKAKGVEPMLVALRNAEGQCVAMLPFAVQQSGPLRIASFLGGRDSNFNLGLFRRGEEPTGETLLPCLLRAAKLRPLPPDLYDLRNQPDEFEGAVNPLVVASSRPSASDAYGAHLPALPAELDKRLSKDARKKLRRKEARLAELGEVRYEHGATGARADEIVDALISQKSLRLGSAKVASHFTEQPFRQFLRQMLSPPAPKSFEVHGLSLSGKIVAAYAGVLDGTRFSAMLNSYDMTNDIARCSPGDLLLHSLMRNLSSRGFAHFDLGIGEARYKNAVCDERIRLYDTIIPITRRGAAAAPILAFWLYVKRTIKKHPALTMFLMRARSSLKF